MKYPEPHDPFDGFNEDYLTMSDEEFDAELSRSGVDLDALAERHSASMQRLRREFPTNDE